MSVLAKLKLTNAKRVAKFSPNQRRRNKLIERIDEQIELARARQSGAIFSPKRLCKVLNENTGEKTIVEVAKRVRDWTFVNENGKTCLTIRYGATIVELAKGKTAIELASDKEVISTLELVKQAVQNGELDSQLEESSGTLKAGFVK